MNVGPGKPMPEDGAIQVSFDRYLLPSTVTRQSIAILDGSNRNLPASLLPVVTYDPIARTATLSAPVEPWLTKGQVYKLIVGIPDGDSDLGGVRAIDRATLNPEQEHVFAFVVGEPTKKVAPVIDFCRDVMPIFQAKCSRLGCHGDDESAASGLVLSTSTGIARTALNRVAKGASTGASSTAPTPPGHLFGLGMPLIAPGNPGDSFLLYKVELAAVPPDATATPDVVCEGRSRAPASPYTPLLPILPSSDAERGRLGDAILGSPMPYPSSNPLGYPDRALTVDEREAVRRWIASLDPASTLPECGACGRPR